MKIPDRLTPLTIGVLSLSLLAGLVFAMTVGSGGSSSAHPGAGGGAGGVGPRGDIIGGGTGGGTCICQVECGTTTFACGSYSTGTCGNCVASKGCPANPVNGSYSCSGTDFGGECDYSCGLTCSTGYHTNTCASGSGNTCVADSPAACGPSCTVCSAPANATATCTNGVCGAVCNSNYHPCSTSGGSCSDIDGTDCTCAALGASSCGDSCLSCAAPANGSSGCSVTTGSGSGGACVFGCNAGYWLSSQSTTSASCTSQSFVTTF